ncbi:MAG: hypothetical protein ACOYYS_02005 [Chloroflexota bacterium]
MDRLQSKAASTRFSAVAVVLLLAIVFWVARYWRSAGFLLYEDDWMIVPQAVDFGTAETLRFIANYILQMRGHARPLSDSLIYLFSHLAGQAGGIWAIYLAGYAIQLLNIGLFYALLRRLAGRAAFTGRAFALLGGLGYCLFSADTTQVFLTHSLGLHPSITLVLLAFHLFLSGKTALAYLPAGVILFSYETPYLLFLAAPLLLRDWDARWAKKALRHVLIVLGLLGAVFVFRSAIGEGRVGGLGWQALLATPVLHMLQGPWVSLGSYFLRPVQALAAGKPEALLAASIAFPVLLALFLRLKQREKPWDWAAAATALRARRWSAIPPQMRLLLQLSLAALVLIALAYPLTFTVRAYAISGRDTRVHAAAVVGAGLLWGCVGQALFAAVRRPRGRILASTGLSATFALLVAYGFVIQADYVRAAQLQRNFWAELLPLIADMQVKENMVVLIEPGGLEDTAQIGANTWILPRLLERMYPFPPEWNHPPRVYRLMPGWPAQLAAPDGLLRVNGATAITAWTENFTVPSDHVIWIDTQGGVLQRRAGPLVFDGQSYPLYAYDHGERLWERRPGIWYAYFFSP